MKFTLTITDMTREDVADVAGRLGAEVVQAVTPQAPVETPSTVTSPLPIPTPVVEGPIPSPATVDVDADGLPWDERIHAGSKEQTGAGKWKKKKGVGKDKAFIAQVEAELRGAPQNVPQPPVETAPVEQANVPQPPAEQAAVPQPPMTPPAETAPVEQATVPQGQANSTVDSLIHTAQTCQCRTDITFETMMDQVNVALADPNNPIGPTELPKICASFGIQTLPDCANSAETIGKIYYVLGGQ